MSYSTSNVVHLSYIMDRPRAAHRWMKAFQQMDDSDEQTRRTICSNWRMDYRVSQAREQHMLDTPDFKEIPDAEDWWRQFRTYYGRKICCPTTPGIAGSKSAYAESFNSNNLLSRHTIPGHEQLIHVASLSRILWRLASAEYASALLKLQFADITGFKQPQRPMSNAVWNREAFTAEIDTIVDAIRARGQDTVRALAGLLCDSLGDSQPPWWACFAEEVNSLLDQGHCAALCRALGLGHFEMGDWLLVWRYEVSSAGPLYRPTVVEAIDNPFHFPSPPTSTYGITMPLALSQAACREVLHLPLFGTTAIAACTGELFKIDDSPVVDYNSINSLRSWHRQRLEREWTDSVDNAWLQRHNNLI